MKDVIMSIHPEYVDLIFDGKKRYEFRKSRFTSDVAKIFIYATAPIKKIVGMFDMGCFQAKMGVLKMRTRDLWDVCKDESGIEKDQFMDYYDGNYWGYAIKIRNVVKFKHPIVVKSELPQWRPPQSYSYLKPYFPITKLIVKKVKEEFPKIPSLIRRSLK